MAPLLREEGFSGSGRTFRRFVDGLAHVVQVQASRRGGQFAINLGIHPLNVPMDFCSDHRKMNEADCAFRRRLSLNGEDQWWSHDASETSTDAAVSNAAAVYVTAGRPKFAAMTAPEAPLRTLTAAELSTGASRFHGFWSNDVRMAFLLARMRQADGDQQAAREFARFALDEIGDKMVGSALIPELRAIIAD